MEKILVNFGYGKIHRVDVYHDVGVDKLRLIEWIDEDGDLVRGAARFRGDVNKDGEKIWEWHGNKELVIK